jgi:hypothetical protein
MKVGGRLGLRGCYTPAMQRASGTTFERIIAVDWSGRVDSPGQRRHIWVAECREGVFLPLQSRRTRAEVCEWLINEKAITPSMLVGLDFAFSCPQWFVKNYGETAPEFWRHVADNGEVWLRECNPPFWGRSLKKCPAAVESEPRYRETEKQHSGAIRPKSVFQIGGAGAVGTGSLRGMPYLAQLRAAGFAVWPFDEPASATVVEIYPRFFTGEVRRSDQSARTKYLQQNHFAGLTPEVRAGAENSEDAFDALVSVAEMATRLVSFEPPNAVSEELVQAEGWIYAPAHRQMAG